MIVILSKSEIPIASIQQIPVINQNLKQLAQTFNYQLNNTFAQLFKEYMCSNFIDKFKRKALNLFDISPMKKYQDKQIALFLRQVSQTQIIQINCSIHTNIHAIKILACKQLNLPPLQTSIQIFSNAPYPLKATSTLLQNGITKDSSLMIHVKNTTQSKILLTANQVVPKEVLETGLSIKYYCKNSKCVNYDRNTVINFGFGEFDVNGLIDHINCQICPYKSQKIHVSVGCRQIIVKQCLFSILTIEHDEASIFKQKQSGWIKAKNEKLITRRLSLGEKEIGKILKVKKL